MENPYTQYYMNQAGSGIVSYSGHRYQSGKGFGKILKKLAPALKYIASKGWEAIRGIGGDIISGKHISDAGKNQLIRSAESILTDARDKVGEIKKQKGLGRKRKKRKTVKKSYKRRKVTQKTKNKIKRSKRSKKSNKKY